MIAVSSRRRVRAQGRRTLAVSLGVLLGTLLAVASQGVPAQAQTTGQWQFTGSMASGHGNWWNSGFVQLPDGRVLAISGADGPGSLTAAAEVYDPGTGTWASGGTLNDARYAFGTPSVLPDGDVLVAGGHDVNVNDYATAELYDPATSKWTLTGSLNTSRRYPVQVGLANGEVLVATGSHGLPTCTRYLSSAELYNPATGQWTYTGSTLVPRESADAIRLADGRVLLAGGYNGGGSACTDTEPVDTEIYDPSTGQWSSAGNLPHGWLNGVMVLLPDHRVLLVDGSQEGSGSFAEAMIFNPATNQWSEAAKPILARAGAAATLLSDGKVLVSQGGQLQSEIYDPATDTWSLDATALDAHNGGHTFLLPGGKVLLAGGGNSTGVSETTGLYTPASPDNDLAIATPAGTTADAASSSGATVSYPLPAVTDPDDPTAPAPDCSPAPGKVFPIGTTTVTCTATDPDDGNFPVTTTFTITVNGAAAQLTDLYQAVQRVGTGTSLVDKITQAQSYLAAGDTTDASATLSAFINEVSAQSGKSIPADQASQLIADAQRIQAVMHLTAGASGPPVFNPKYSGYVTSYEHAYYNASADWTVPANNCPSPVNLSAAGQWVGLGGVSDPTHPSTPLVQAGIASSCIGGQQVNLLVWEAIPPDTAVNYVFGYQVDPGDQIYGSINYQGGYSYHMVVTDKTQRWTWSKTVSTDSNEVPTTAEWIVECGLANPADLADFGNITFADVSYSTATTHGTLLGSADSVPTAPFEVVTGGQQMTTVSPIAPPGTFTVTYIPQ